MMRYVLFAGTNMAVMLVISVIAQLFGVHPSGMTQMLIMSAAIGIIGSLVSLMMSKGSAIRGAGVQIIETPSNDVERWLVETVHAQADKMGIGHPDVGIFNDPSPNAFATGAKKNDALVAVSTGLLNNMDKGEVEAVLGHEVAHVANGDMVTMALLQGVVNAFVLVLARLAGTLLAGGRDGRGGMGMMGHYLGYYVGQIAFGFLATLIVRYFSRRREYRADVGGAELAGRQQMINALEKLKGGQEAPLPENLKAFAISGGALSTGLRALKSTHPKLDDRIAALREAA